MTGNGKFPASPQDPHSLGLSSTLSSPGQPSLAPPGASPTALETSRENPERPGLGRRCGAKGCVFPAASGDSGNCLYHSRLLDEPSIFHSRQPTLLVLDQSMFFQPESEYPDTRARDRRRLASLREAFLDGAA